MFWDICCCFLTWYIVNNQWMMSECFTLKNMDWHVLPKCHPLAQMTVFCSKHSDKLIWCFCEQFLWKWSKMKQHLFKDMEATGAKVTAELCTHTHRPTQAQKQILTNVSRSHPSSSILPQGTTSLTWGNRWAEPSTVSFCCCFFPLVKVRKTCNSGSVAKCQTTWKIIKTDNLKTPTRPDGPTSLKYLHYTHHKPEEIEYTHNSAT